MGALLFSGVHGIYDTFATSSHQYIGTKLYRYSYIFFSFQNESLPWQQQSFAYMVTKEELDMPIAYSILVYTDLKMLELLLESIFKPHNIYCIHVDNKSSQVYKDSVYKLASCHENVFVAKKMHNIEWGKFSIVEAEMSCMEELLAKSGTWKYFINLTGQEFPLRTNYELARILTSLGGRNEVFCRPM